eukprot:CAMPEP_0180664180 /NCGR_PEP_ID=MMETSP1037_2-20121125/60460_1 /TAXON_ID=632150 /ORGANISM="Azadinium spinosum, Strain 3D9" /LENGTH=44 /DNA_ID= /DNA_START= /DNA_END= /DNA_ORIENTATION=
MTEPAWAGAGRIGETRVAQHVKPPASSASSASPLPQVNVATDST